MSPAWRDLRGVVFDVDGTLLDSADGIVAGFRHALESVDVVPPDDATLARTSARRSWTCFPPSASRPTA